MPSKILYISQLCIKGLVLWLIGFIITKLLLLIQTLLISRYISIVIRAMLLITGLYVLLIERNYPVNMAQIVPFDIRGKSFYLTRVKNLSV